VPADYAAIREQNIARYGWDTAVLDLLGQLYSERTHFIFELIQNAEDASATELSFMLYANRLELTHDGRPFTEADVRGICGVGETRKPGDFTQIGQFGIGFKSVYAYTKTPQVDSGGEHFRIENYVRPYPEDPPAGPVPGTRFVFPFDHDTVPAATAVAEIAAALNHLDPRTLLFLRSIGQVRIGGEGVTDAVLHRTTARRTETSRRVTLTRGRGHREEWLVWARSLASLGHPGQQAEIAFPVAAGTGGQLAGCADSPLVVFFPTEKQTFLGFLVQGPYRTTPARDNVPEGDPANQAMVRETAALLSGVLTELRDESLLTVAVLEALPLDAARFPRGSMFRPLYDVVHAALSGQDVIPAAGGGYRAAQELKLAADPGLRDLLSPGQLGALYGAGGPLAFADESIREQQAPELWHCLRDEIGIEELTGEALVQRAGCDFLAAQPDDWIARYYAFLYRQARLWQAPRFGSEPPGPARAAPIIRLADGRQVTPFDAAGRPAAYLPGPARTSLPVVRQGIADEPAAREFLVALGFTEPDLVAEVLDIVLPRYSGLEVAALDIGQHHADVESVVRALDGAAGGQRDQLLQRVRGTAFLIGENAATGEQRFMLPPELYQRTKDLESYFDGNPDAWFASDTYGPWLPQLRGIGVRDGVRIRVRRADPHGHVVIADEFARHERGLDGFDPEAEIDGLDFALRHPGHARSEYVWNALLVPNRQLVAGVVQKSVREQFRDATQDEVTSAIGVAATSSAWLPGPDGAFRRPAALSLDDLPPAYQRDEGLAKALRMTQPVVAEASRQLGIPPEVLWGLSAHPDLVAAIQRELKLRASELPASPVSGPHSAGLQRAPRFRR
jgi:hypothetical protein